MKRLAFLILGERDGFQVIIDRLIEGGACIARSYRFRGNSYGIVIVNDCDLMLIEECRNLCFYLTVEEIEDSILAERGIEVTDNEPMVESVGGH